MAKDLKRKSVKIIAICLAIAIIIPIILEIGVVISSSYKAYVPDYEKIDISEILTKDELTDEDYETLFNQTGLTRLGIDGLIENGLAYRIIKIQEQYFEKQSYYFYSFSPFTGYLRRKGKNAIAQFAYLENGDILYSPTTFFSFIKIGHTSMMVDASLGIMAQASGHGIPVMPIHISRFFSRPAFVILRADGETGNAVANYTQEFLMGKRYSLFAGIFGEKAPENISSTHCSHFIWYAYMQSGIDIDSDGGKIVTPDDILYSENLSIVQIYGISPDILIEN